MKNFKYNKGFTLIEAMIAVVVFSFGLLGVAGVMAVSVKSNHNGYMRSQALFLATSMGDMMRANPEAVKTGSYNVTGQTGYASVATMCYGAGNNDCNPTQLKSRDIQLWSNMITQMLPNSSGTISCTAHADLPELMYSGLCEVKIDWRESSQDEDDSAQSISIMVKP